MRTVAVLGLALLLGACANTVLVKPGATQYQVDQDVAECTYQAEAAVVTINNAISAGIRQAELTQSCLRAKGYRPQPRQ